jgi:DNA-binding NarL/FixJ family response regulator
MLTSRHQIFTGLQGQDSSSSLSALRIWSSLQLRNRALSALRILVVDDDSTIRRVIRIVLSEPHFEIVGEATDGEEAVRLVPKLKPDVVIMNLAMPRMSGIEATRRIKQVSPEVTVVAFTATSDPSEIVAMIEAGALTHVPKADLAGLVQMLGELGRQV